MTLARDRRRDRTRKHRYRQPRKSSLGPYGRYVRARSGKTVILPKRVQGLVGDPECRVGSRGHV